MRITFLDKVKLGNIVKAPIERKRAQLDKLIAECQECIKKGDLKRAQKLLDQTIVLRDEISTIPFSLIDNKKLTPEVINQYANEFDAAYDASSKVANLSMDASNASMDKLNQQLDGFFESFDSSIGGRGKH